MLGGPHGNLSVSYARGLLLLGIFFCTSSLQAAAISSTASGGTRNWSDTNSWVGGVFPGQNDTVTIVVGSSVTLDGSQKAKTVTINGTLAFDRVAASTLTMVTGDIT